MTLLEQIKETGIVRYGRAGFPTHVEPNCTVEHLVINAAECEPLLRIDRFLMSHKIREIVMAAGMIGDMVQAGKCYIAPKEIHSEEIVALEATIAGFHNPVRLHKMRNSHPADDEQIMVYDVARRTVLPSGIPSDVGAVVSNLATVYSIYNVSQGQPFTEKYLTVTGVVNSLCIVRTPLGVSFAECLLLVRGSNLSSFHVIIGGPMMDRCYRKEGAAGLTVTKTTSGYITVADGMPLVEKHDASISVSLRRTGIYCIQCSYCTRMYPRYLAGHPLKPHMIMRKLAYAQSPEEVLEDKHVRRAMICSEHGPCETYACPMGLQSRRVNVYVKNLLRQNEYRYPKPSETLTQPEERGYRKAPSKRVAARLGADQYYDCRIDGYKAADPATVRIPLRQHIGTPS